MNTGHTETASPNRELSRLLNLRHSIGDPVPNFTHDGNDMLVLIEAMRKRGYDLSIDVQCMEMGGAWVAWTHVELSDTTKYDLDKERIPEAVAICALQALNRHKSDQPPAVQTQVCPVCRTVHDLPLCPRPTP